MENTILGLHHITAIAGDARRNFDFYTRVMGLRMVKRTVNFDDPSTYHFYFGNESGMPGTILTFFPWGNIGPGVNGTGMATEIGYAVPAGSLAFWENRFTRNNVKFEKQGERFGEQTLLFRDPDGLALKLIVPLHPDDRKPWESAEVSAAEALRGFHSVTLLVRNVAATAAVLTDIFGYRLLKQAGSHYRFVTDAIAEASIVDIIEAPGVGPGRGRAGTNHHVAFRVKNEEILMAFREKIEAKGFNITPKIDRNYFFSLYFREPGGVLFELATDNPGFTVDEPLHELGTHLKLPEQYEHDRAIIKKALPSLGINEE